MSGARWGQGRHRLGKRLVAEQTRTNFKRNRNKSRQEIMFSHKSLFGSDIFCWFEKKNQNQNQCLAARVDMSSFEAKGILKENTVKSQEDRQA